MVKFLGLPRIVFTGLVMLGIIGVLLYYFNMQLERNNLMWSFFTYVIGTMKPEMLFVPFIF